MLPPDILASLVGFTAVNSITPGPNNIMLTASGVNFGFRRTVPHVLGVMAGFALLVVSVGFGLGAVFAALPSLQIVLKILGGVYLLWLAWKTGNAGEIHSAGMKPEPMTIWEAIAFQAVNPKAWFMAISAMSIYVRPGHIIADVALVSAILMSFNVVSANIWAGFGTALRPVLQEPHRVRIFNIVMGLALAASIIPMVFA